MAFIKSLPERTSLLDVFKRWPEQFKPLIEFHEVLLRRPGTLSDSQRELIAAFVSGRNGCEYCHGIHARVAEQLGTPAGLVDRLIEDIENAGIDAATRAALRYASKLTADPASVTQADFDAMLEAGLDEEGAFEVVATVALFNLMNRLVEGLGVRYDEQYTRTAAQRLSRDGYLPLLQMMGFANPAGR